MLYLLGWSYERFYARNCCDVGIYSFRWNRIFSDNYFTLHKLHSGFEIVVSKQIKSSQIENNRQIQSAVKIANRGIVARHRQQ